jgi:hypothetical protein
MQQTPALGADLKYAGLCVAVYLTVLLACRCSATTFDRFHFGSRPIWDLGAFGCSIQPGVPLAFYVRPLGLASKIFSVNLSRHP